MRALSHGEDGCCSTLCFIKNVVMRSGEVTSAEIDG